MGTTTIGSITTIFRHRCRHHKTMSCGKEVVLRSCFIAMVFSFLAFLACSAEARGFSVPEKLPGSGTKDNLNRLANGILKFDSHDRLHLVFWSGRSATSPSTPTRIYHQDWSRDGGWGAPAIVDNSLQGSTVIGGRHPALAVQPDDTIWVFWHDHRHCTGAGNWIDQLEIYANSKPWGGSFADTDLRLTTSAAGHFGDNGYLPRAAVQPDGSLVVVWYDFFANGHISDLYLAQSSPGGEFSATTMHEMQLTNASERGDSPSFTIPDIGVDSAGVRHLVWLGGTVNAVDIFYASYAPTDTELNPMLIAANAGNYFDPPHLIVGADDDVWLVYSDNTIISQENIVLRRKPAGEDSFMPPWQVISGTSRQYAPNFKIDSKGVGHLVWVEHTPERVIKYARLNLASQSVIEEMTLTPHTAQWARPTLAINSQDQIVVVFEEDLSPSDGSIWFVYELIPSSVGNEWVVGYR